MNPSEYGHCQHTENNGRRDFLGVGALNLLGISLSQFLRLSQAQAAAKVAVPIAKAQACILLWLEGGPSQVDTWDPKGNTGFNPISTKVPGLQISEILPKISQHMDKLSVIRSMRTQERNHPQGTIESLTGQRPNPAQKFPSFGSIVAKELGARNNLPPFVVVPKPSENDFFNYQEAYQAAFAGSEYDGMILPDPSRPGFAVPDLSLPKSVTQEALEDRRTLLSIVDRHYREKEAFAAFAKMDSFQTQALQMILSPQVKQAFDFSQESDQTKDAYGRHRVGQSALLARRLVEAGCRFVTAAGYKHGQWDTHGNNEQRLRETLAPMLDQTLSALLEDLNNRGMLESTVVIAMGEFGRTPNINTRQGRDHWPDCWSLVVGGGGIRPGQIVGASDARGAYVTDCPVSIGDLYATIYKALGIDWEKTYLSPAGRPVYIANGFGDKAGSPIMDLI
ncbi:MAG: DUF1501 domain-containing protein [Planctomycetales bacterium]|nr:DUF1501 domain-containing protein [Planctomycetales bacterium]